METTLKHIEEYVIPGKRLGRHVEHDPRSREFSASPLVDPSLPFKSHTWTRRVPIFDQGQLGSCTGNACLGHLGTVPDARKEVNVNFVEDTAVQLYSLATHLDGFGEAYPPNDRGSSTIGVLKAAQQLGWITKYVWSFDFKTTRLVLGYRGPVIVGVNWYDSFDNPDSSGKVSISPNAQVRGGHEFEVYAIDIVHQEAACDNSWGDSWGDKGRFYISLSDLERLLSEQGEVGIGLR